MSALDEVIDTVEDAPLHLRAFAKQARAELAALRAEVARKDEALLEAIKLLKEAKDLLDGTHGLCDTVNSEEWYWKWSVRYYLSETDIPVHRLPKELE